MENDEKENLKQIIHERIMEQIDSLGSFSNPKEILELQENICRLAESENERYTMMRKS